MTLRSAVRRRPVPAFLLVTFGWSWGLDALVFALDAWSLWWVTIPRTWGPMIGAVAVTWASETPLREWAGRVTNWRVRPRLYAVALLVPVGISNLRPILGWLGGGSVSLTGIPLYVFPIQLVGVMVLAGGLEEFGWRGFLQPRVQESASALVAGIAVGAVWVIWHLPLFVAGLPNYGSDPSSLLYYAAWVVGSAVVLGALVNAAEGSVLPAMLLHASINLPALLESSGGSLADAIPREVIGAGPWWLIVATLAAVYGAASLSPRPAVLPIASAGENRDGPAVDRGPDRRPPSPSDE